MRPDNWESKENEEDKLRQKVDNLEKQVAEKSAENRKFKDVLTEARNHIRTKKSKESEDLKQFEALKEENADLELRMKKSLEKIENLDAKVSTLTSQNQMVESRDEKLRIDNRRLQENVETAHETIVKKPF